MVSMLLAVVDIVALGILFWFVPTRLLRYLKSQLGGVSLRPLQLLLDLLPGAIAGTAFGAACVYLLGMSYEDFAVKSARTVGNYTLELVGMDATSACVARLVETYKLTPTRFVDEAVNVVGFAGPTATEYEVMMIIARQIVMMGSVQGDANFTQNVFDQSLRQFCKERGAVFGRM